MENTNNYNCWRTNQNIRYLDAMKTASLKTFISYHKTIKINEDMINLNNNFENKKLKKMRKQLKTMRELKTIGEKLYITVKW